MAYCTLAQARAAGANPTDDAAVTAAIAAAKDRITRYTGELFEPTAALTVVADVGHNGVAPLRYRVRTIASVTPVLPPGSSAWPSSAWVVHSSRTPGDYDGLQLAFGAGGYDDLVVGAESYNGGWVNLLGRAGEARQLAVVGDFGWDSPPLEVQQAAARLAALLAPTPWAPQTNAEGDLQGVPPGDETTPATPEDAAPPSAPGERTTGDPVADELLRDLVKRRVKVS